MKHSSRTQLNKEISGYQIFQVNAFVDRDCRGNSAGVCLLPEEIDIKRFGRIAAGMAMSETAFLYETGGVLQLRWFHPNGTEADLCGHATLATAYILWNKGYVNPGEIIDFHTKSGVLSAKLEEDFISLSFPAESIVEIKRNEYRLHELLGLSPVYTGRTRFDYLIVVDSEEAVKRLTPDFEKLKRIPTRGITVTAKSLNPEYDYVARFFAPSVGVNEDPVTGSAHCYLGTYWGTVLNKNTLTGYQASPEGGMVKVAISGNRILVSGRSREVAIAEEKKREVLSCLKMQASL